MFFLVLIVPFAKAILIVYRDENEQIILYLEAGYGSMRLLWLKFAPLCSILWAMWQLNWQCERNAGEHG